MALNRILGSVWNPEDNEYTSPLANSVARTLQSKFEDTVSVKDFGAVGDGATDDTTAIQNALDSSTALYFPAGTYNVNLQLTASDKAITLLGDGIGLSIIKWVTGSLSSGISISQSTDTFITNVIGLSLLTELVNSGTALTVDGTGQLSGGIVQDRLKTRVNVQDVEARGDVSPNTDGWQRGLLYTNCIHTRTTRFFFIGNFSGTQDNIQSITGILLQGTGSPTEHSILQCNIFYAVRAIEIINTVEGVYITHCNLVADFEGVNWKGDSGQPPQLAMVANHANVYGTCVVCENMSQSFITNNLFYSRQDAVAATQGVRFVDNVQHSHIENNLFVNNSGFNMISVNLVGTSTANNTVKHNIFQSGTTAVLLNAGVFNNQIIDNLINNAFAADVTDNSGNSRNAIQTLETQTVQRVDNNLSTLEMNSLSSGNRDTTVDLHSDDVNTDFSARIIRTNGENGTFDFINLGTGAIRIAHNGIEVVSISASGMELNQGGVGDRNTLVDYRSDDVNADFSARIIRSAGENGDFALVNKGTGDIVFLTNNTGRFLILGNENTIQYSVNGIRITTGAGSPEGVVTAVVGSTYQRSDGGVGTTFYVKESGVGNTGWVAK